MNTAPLQIKVSRNLPPETELLFCAQGINKIRALSDVHELDRASIELEFDHFGVYVENSSYRPMKTKREWYYQIARNNTPENVRYIQIKSGVSGGYLARAHVIEGWIEAPRPDTIDRLWIFLHECAHMRMHTNVLKCCNSPSQLEAEAELDVMDTLDREGVTIPWRRLNTAWATLFCLAHSDEKGGWERHPLVTECLEEFSRRQDGKPIPRQRRQCRNRSK